MCKFIRKSNERILCKLSKSEILRLYSIVHVAMETTKTSNFTCQSKSFISIFFTCQVSACELQPSSCHDLANDITDKLPKACSATLIGVYLSQQYGSPNERNFCSLIIIVQEGKKNKIFHYNLSACAGN